MMAPFSPSLFDLFFYLANKLALIDIYVTYTRTWAALITTAAAANNE